jgi:hypothetical protein
MRVTHRVIPWFRWHGAHKFKKMSCTHNAYVKKNGIIVYWNGAYHNYFASYFQNEKDANMIRSCRQDDFGRIRRYETYYTLEKL